MKVEAKIAVESAAPVARRGAVAEGKFGEVLDRVVGKTAAAEQAVPHEGECPEGMPGEACGVDPRIVGASDDAPVTVAIAIEVVSVSAPVETPPPEVIAEEDAPAESIASTPDERPETATAMPEPHVVAAPAVADPAVRHREVEEVVDASGPERAQPQRPEASPVVSRPMSRATSRDRSSIDVPASAPASVPERASVPASPIAIAPDHARVAARAPIPVSRATEAATASPRGRRDTPSPTTKPVHTDAPASAPAAKRASVDAPAPTPTAPHVPDTDAPAPPDARIAAPSSDAPPARVAEPSTQAPEAAVPTSAPSSTAPAITPSTPPMIDATPSLAVGLEPIAAPDVPTPTEPMPATVDPTLPGAPKAESIDPTRLAEEATATPRTSDPEVAERIEKVRTALEKLRPIPDGGVAVDVDLDGIGRIELRVEPIDGGMRVSLGTDEPTALARLEAQRSELEQALRHNGETLSLDIHTGGRRARTPRPPAPSRDGDPTPSRTDTASPRRSGRGLVDVVA